MKKDKIEDRAYNRQFLVVQLVVMQLLATPGLVVTMEIHSKTIGEFVSPPISQLLEIHHWVTVYVSCIHPIVNNRRNKREEGVLRTQAWTRPLVSERLVMQFFSPLFVFSRGLGVLYG